MDESIQLLNNFLSTGEYTSYAKLYKYYINNGCDYNKHIEICINLKSNSNALFLLGFFYNHGCGIVMDLNEACKYYDASIKMNNSYAMTYMSLISLSEPHFNISPYEPFVLLETAIKLNNPDAFEIMGEHLYYDKNDIKSAVQYHKQAMKNNCIHAMRELLIIYSCNEVSYLDENDILEICDEGIELGDFIIRDSIRDLISKNDKLFNALLKDRLVSKNKINELNDVINKQNEYIMELEYMPNGVGYEMAREEFERLKLDLEKNVII